MVSLSDILLNNTSLHTPGSGPIVALVGCTSGIGLSTLHAFLKHTSAPTIYLIGRDSSRLTSLIAQVQPLNPSATLHPIVGDDLTLIRDAQHAAEQITSHSQAAPPPRLDILVMSQGFLSFASTPDFSPEGLDRITSIRYHSRMRILVTLLPLLRRSASPRVLNILGAGKEGALDLSDLGMTKSPGTSTYGPLYAAGAAGSMTTLFLEELSKRPGNEKIVFIHLFPGLVAGTGLKVQGPGSSFWVRFLWDYIAKPILSMVSYSFSEAGERVLFAATNGRFRRLPPGTSAEGTLIQQGSDGTQGSGVYTINADSSVIGGGGNADLRKLRGMNAGQEVYEYTMAEFRRIDNLQR
ncbi:hypothetical protein LTR92_006612 [Exophiala xenobiotica]|nr:hypothetical protein LTR92_006612 [Exophiala xenobiotica]